MLCIISSETYTCGRMIVILVLHTTYCTLLGTVGSCFIIHCTVIIRLIISWLVVKNNHDWFRATQHGGVQDCHRIGCTVCLLTAPCCPIPPHIKGEKRNIRYTVLQSLYMSIWMVWLATSQGEISGRERRLVTLPRPRFSTVCTVNVNTPPRCACSMHQLELVQLRRSLGAAYLHNCTIIRRHALFYTHHATA